MLRLWRDEICIALSPDRVALARVSRGWTRKVIAKHAVQFSSSEPGNWSRCVEALQQALQELHWESADASVVLSNHFIRYALVPWSEHLGTENEKQAWVDHYFTELYGKTAVATADYRWSDDGPHAACVATAVDKDFMAQVRASFDKTSLRLRSIQPYLMKVFNRWKPHVKRHAVWLILLEPGRLCIAALADGRWRMITSKKIGVDSENELSLELERQLLLANEAIPIELLVYAPDISNLELAYKSDLHLTVLAAKALPGYQPYVDGEYSMALSGVA